jgi:hypothetical protein
MSGDALVQRVTRFLEHHIAACEAQLDAPDAPPPDEPGEEDTRAAARQSASFSQAEEELRILLQEWQAAPGVDAEAQARVRQLAARAQEVSMALARRRTREAQAAAEHTERVREELGTLHRGRQTLTQYRAGRRGEAGYLDRDA